MNATYSATLLLISLATLIPTGPLHADGSPEVEIRHATTRWEAELQAGNFTTLRQHFQAWTAPDFSFTTRTGARAIDRLIEAEKQDVGAVHKSQSYFEKTYGVRPHLSIRFSVQSLQVHGDMALEEALLAYRLPATGKKKMPDGMVQGESGDLGHSEVYHIIWTRTPRGWKMRFLRIFFNPMIGTALFIEQAKGAGAGGRK